MTEILSRCLKNTATVEQPVGHADAVPVFTEPLTRPTGTTGDPEISLGEMCQWAARCPDEVEILPGGDFWFMAAYMPEYAD